MKRIVLCNDGVDSANKGDQAILRAMLPALRERFPDARIEVFSYSGTRSPRRVLKLRREGETYRKETYRSSVA